VKVAVTLVAAVGVRVQGVVPVQAPLHPAKLEPVAGAAVRVMAMPCRAAVVQVVPQLMPAGLDTMVPAPLPVLVTVNG
jgi:hypothetical protein